MKKLYFKNGNSVFNADAKEFFQIQQILKASNINEVDQRKITDMIEKISLHLQHATRILDIFMDAANNLERKYQ